jgi:hypothetical protein
MEKELSELEKLKIIDEKIYNQKLEEPYKWLDNQVTIISKRFNISKEDVYQLLLEMNGVRKA